jgi:hypothetical protein
MNKKQIIATSVLAGALVLTGAYGIQKANAATDTNFPPMIQKLVDKFNLNKDEVSKLVEENRTARQDEREDDFEKKLTEAVIAGKITEAQKTAILAKHEELQTKREALRDQNQDNRQAMRTQMEAIRTEMQDFLKSQGVDQSILPEPKGPQGGGMGMGSGMHRGQNQ